ncbi:MAG TPA: hypothetical protein VFV23_05565 [Verrucomicrobiae bacterium]|nr:hypothetical protein [Verrucomicrobiae bacterium]
MKAKIVLYFVLLAMLTSFATGCCTSKLMKDFHQTRNDYFNPSRVYASTNSNDFALESSKFNPPFAIISQKEIASHNLSLTNTCLSLEQIKNLPPDLTKRAKLEKTLPPNYEKVADLQTNKVYIAIREHHPGRVVIVFLPFTVAVDVATAPFQLIAILAWSHAMNWN